MGIKKLFTYLKNNTDIIEEKNVKCLRNKKMAIDISILLYQSIINQRQTGSDLLNSEGEIVSQLLGIFNKTCKFIELGIKPVYVFDGKPPELKNKTINERRETKIKALERLKCEDISDDEKVRLFKKCVFISKKQKDATKKMLTLMGIPYVDAPEEADSQCAYLAKNKLVDCVYTEDMDILTFGSPKIVRNINDCSYMEIDLDNIQNKLDISNDEFIQFCILLGTDYSDSISSLYPKQLLDIYKSCNIKNLEDIETKLKENNSRFYPINNYEQVKYYFKNPTIKSMTKEDIKWTEPQIDELNQFLIVDCGFTASIIKKKVKRLSKLIGFF